MPSYVVVDTDTNAIVSNSSRLPFTCKLPDGSFVDFSAVGQISPSADNPKYRVDEIPDPPPPPPQVPAQVTALQARLALIQVGLLSQVEAAVAQASDEIKVYWEYSTIVRRDSSFIAAMAPALGLNEAALDNLFVLAETL